MRPPARYDSVPQSPPDDEDDMLLADLDAAISSGNASRLAEAVNRIEGPVSDEVVDRLAWLFQQRSLGYGKGLSDDLRRDAVRAIGRCFSPSRLFALVAALFDRNDAVSVEAAELLAKAGDDGVFVAAQALAAGMAAPQWIAEAEWRAVERERTWIRSRGVIRRALYRAAAGLFGPSADRRAPARADWTEWGLVRAITIANANADSAVLIARLGRPEQLPAPARLWGEQALFRTVTIRRLVVVAALAGSEIYSAWVWRTTGRPRRI